MRRQLPVHSPVTWRAVMAGTLAGVRGDASGRLRARVEEWARARYGARDVLLTDSGTSALRLAIEAAIAAAPGPVALPAFNCYDVATAAVGAGARVALYDLDPETLGPDPESLTSARAQAPSAFVLAHLYGLPVDVGAARELVGDALIIEDAAQAAGAELGGRLAGSLGSLAVLSFGRGKGMTGGGGGALLANDERGAALLRSVRGALLPGGRGLRSMVGLAGQHVLGRPWLYGLPASIPWLHLGETVYRDPHPAREASAAALAALETIIAPSDAEAAVRRRNAERLSRAVERSSRVRAVRPAEGARPGYLRLPVIAAAPGRAAILSGSERRLGVMPSYPTSLVEVETLARILDGPVPDIPGARLLARELVTLPTHALMGERDLEAVEAWLGGG